MDASFVATLLRTSAEGFAGLAASRFWEDDANDLGAAGDGFGAWKAHLREQVLQLAAAVEDGSPAMFAGHQAWLREAGSARGVTSDALQSACHHLAAVLEESLPPEGWKLLPPLFAAGDETLASPAPVSTSHLPTEGLAAKLARGYLACIDEGDERGACDLLSAKRNRPARGGIALPSWQLPSALVPLPVRALRPPAPHRRPHRAATPDPGHRHNRQRP